MNQHRHRHLLQELVASGPAAAVFVFFLYTTVLFDHTFQAVIAPNVLVFAASGTKANATVITIYEVLTTDFQQLHPRNFSPPNHFKVHTTPPLQGSHHLQLTQGKESQARRSYNSF